MVHETFILRCEFAYDKLPIFLVPLSLPYASLPVYTSGTGQLVNRKGSFYIVGKNVKEFCWEFAWYIWKRLGGFDFDKLFTCIKLIM